jgi:glycosyltransferase involved in cell wall biosynthesis
LTVVFSADGLGGSELFNLEYLATARRLGVQVHAVVPGEGSLVGALEPLVRSIQIVEIPSPLTRLSRFDDRLGVKSIPGQAFALARYVMRLRHALARTTGPICCMGFRSQLAVAVAQATSRRPTCWVVHEVVPLGPFARLWSLAARRTDWVYVYSRAAGAQPALRGARVRVMAVRLDLDRFAALPLPEPPLRALGLVGDLFPIKNHLAFADLVGRLRTRGLDISGVMIGRRQSDGKPELVDYRLAVEAAVADAGSNLALEAARPEDMPGALERMDLLVHLTTVPETFGRVCVEAMAAGRPVVAYGHGAVAEVVTDGVVGALRPPHDLAAIEDAIVSLHADPDRFRRMSSAARNHAEREYGRGQDGKTIGEMLAAFAGEHLAR